jgi:hypothetical protein
MQGNLDRFHIPINIAVQLAIHSNARLRFVQAVDGFEIRHVTAGQLGKLVQEGQVLGGIELR